MTKSPYESSYTTPSARKAYLPPPIIPSPPRDPTVNDKNYPVSQIWINESAGSYWALTAFTAGVPNWILLGTISPIPTNLTPPHGVLIAEGTAPIHVTAAGTFGQVLTGTAGGFDPIFAAVGSGSGLTLYGVVYGGGNGPFASTNVGFGGQVLTSNGPGFPPSFQNAPSGGFVWTNVVGASQTIANLTGYIVDNGGLVTFTLPATAVLGNYFRIVGLLGSWTVAQNANQQILYGNNQTTVGIGGSLSSTNARDSLACVATNSGASTVWTVVDSVGNLAIV